MSECASQVIYKKDLGIFDPLEFFRNFGTFSNPSSGCFFNVFVVGISGFRRNVYSTIETSKVFKVIEDFVSL